MAKADLTAQRLRELLEYLPETGAFVRRVDPRKDRPSKWKAGSISGAKNAGGYVSVQVDGVPYLAHRLAWFYQHGVWPDQIDHINGIRSDNRIANLRPATNKQNCENKRVTNSTHGQGKGISFDARRKKWKARIGHNYKVIWLGYFKDAESAAAAYALAAKKIYTHSNLA